MRRATVVTAASWPPSSWDCRTWPSRSPRSAAIGCSRPLGRGTRRRGARPVLPPSPGAGWSACLDAAGEAPGVVVSHEGWTARLARERAWVAIPPDGILDRARDVLDGIAHERALWEGIAPAQEARVSRPRVAARRRGWAHLFPASRPAIWNRSMARAGAGPRSADGGAAAGCGGCARSPGGRLPGERAGLRDGQRRRRPAAPHPSRPGAGRPPRRPRPGGGRGAPDVNSSAATGRPRGLGGDGERVKGKVGPVCRAA